MYSSVIPSDDDEDEAEKTDIINADDPKNVERINKLLYNE